MIPAADVVRFWSHVQPGHSTQCRAWNGHRTDRGYGVFKAAGRSHRAHRVAAHLAHGPAPADRPDVLHSCDSPPCCNPNHLRYGTHAENMADKTRRGRSRYNPASGEAHFRAVLTVDAVAGIRAGSAAGESQGALASRFGVSARTIRDVVSRRTWKEVA